MRAEKTPKKKDDNENISEDEKVAKQILKYNHNVDDPDVKDAWETSYSLRRKEFKQAGTLENVIKEWPILKSPHVLYLVSKLIMDQVFIRIHYGSTRW